jgi:hypothetical protein
VLNWKYWWQKQQQQQLSQSVSSISGAEEGADAATRQVVMC